MSASTPGNINCARYLELKARVQEIWDDSGARKSSYMAVVDTAESILANQSARFKVLEQPDKDRDLKVWWPDDCRSDEPVDCEEQCEVDGPTAGTQCVDYKLQDCFELGYSWTEEQFRQSEMSEAEFVAPMELRLHKIMAEMINKKAIAMVDSLAGVNKYTDQYDVQGNETYIPAPAWNEDLMGYLRMVSKYNRMEFGRILSGSLLDELFWKRSMEVTDPTGASSNRKLNSMGTPVFDIDMDSILTHKALFLWNPNSMVIVNKARHAAYGDTGRVVQTEKGPVIWRAVQSLMLPSVTFDRYEKETCANNDVKHAVKYRFRGDFLTNPIGCDNDLTGVLKFRCGVAA